MIDSVRLEETDDRYIGRIAGFAIGPDGTLLVGDVMQGRVAKFDRRGRFLQMYGRRGRGPGEFGAPTGIAFAGDTVMAVVDSRDNQVTLLRYPSGEYMSTTRSQPAVSGRIAMHNDSIWLGARSLEMKTGMVVLDPVTKGATPFMRFPPGIADWPKLSERYGIATFAILARDSILAIHRGASSTIYLVGADLEVAAAWSIPEQRRWGVPEELGARMQAASSQEEEFRLTSSPTLVHRLASGLIAVLHYDQTLTMNPIQLSNDGWLSVLDLAQGVACVDGAVPLSRDNYAAVRFSGDTLFTAEQAVLEGGGAATFTRAYTLELSGCDWLPLALLT